MGVVAFLATQKVCTSKLRATTSTDAAPKKFFGGVIACLVVVCCQESPSWSWVNLGNPFHPCGDAVSEDRIQMQRLSIQRATAIDFYESKGHFEFMHTFYYSAGMLLANTCSLNRVSGISGEPLSRSVSICVQLGDI